jgi:DnaJ-like protein
LFAFDAIAERRILQAIARGELDGLPGVGKPLALDEDALVPAEARVAHRILKNAGFVPLEILERREIAQLEAALPALDASGRARALAKLAVLRARLFETRMRVRSPARTLLFRG